MSSSNSNTPEEAEKQHISTANVRENSNTHQISDENSSAAAGIISKPRKKVLCIGASPRAGGNTDNLIAKAAEGLREAGVETEIIHLRDYVIQACIGCEQCRRDKTCSQFYDGMHLLYPKIEESAGMVLCSPTYNYNITSMMKSFIDRFYPYFDFENPRPGPYRSRLAEQGRAAIVIGVCEQKEESQMGFTIPAIADAFDFIGYSIVERVPILGHFPRGSVKKDEKALKDVLKAGKKLAKALKH